MDFVVAPSLIQPKMSQEDFSGVICIAQQDQEPVVQCCGQRDLETRTPIQRDTQFNLGSLGKMLTAVAIVQLVEEGRLTFQTQLGKLLPGYLQQQVRQITIHQLLTHTAGTGDIFGPEFLKHRDQLRSVADFVALFHSQTLQFAPGTRHAYSNFGYILLGRMIEVLTGQPFDQVIQSRIFDPLGMSSSGYHYDQAKRLAKPYTGKGSDLHPAEAPAMGTPTGGCFSTVDDLLRFAHGLLQHRLLSPEATHTLTSGKVTTKDQQLYAYGCRDRSCRGERWFGHSGGAPGTNTTLRIFPAAQSALIVLSNRDPPMADALADFLMQGPSDPTQL